MSNRTQLLLNKKEESDDLVLSKFVISLTKNWKVNTELDKGDKAPEDMTEEELEKSAEVVVWFFKDELIWRAIRWNIDLWANKDVIRHMIADWIKQWSKMLCMPDEDWEDLISSCKKKMDK